MKNELTETVRATATLKDYVAIARVDHWFKNVFMLPGVVLGVIVAPPALTVSLIIKLLIGIFSVCLVASANYVINEWLDAPYDKYHPVKKNRPSVVSGLEARYVYLEYAFLAVIGLSLAFSISLPFFGMALFLLVMGVLYNVKPFRTKDRIFMDVISESINNPIRLALGWFIIVPAVPLLFPPSSMMVAYWMGGAFLMGAKRFAEYRFIGNPEIAGLYRKSFKKYNEVNLLVSVFFYALTCTFFLGIFLVKNRIELLVSFPMFAFLFAWYLHLAFRPDSTVQRPEKLYKHNKFMLFLVIFTVTLFVLFYVDIPWLHYFLKQTFAF